MATVEELLEEYKDACREEEKAVTEGRLSPSIMARRDAATRSLHAAEDPWMPCICPTCAYSSD